MMTSPGNFIAYAIVILWPLITVWLYRTKSTSVATLWTILGGFMFLPVKTQIDFPLIPPFGKDSLPVISALIGLWFIKGRKVSFTSNYGWVKYLLLLFIVSPVITAFLNGEKIITAAVILPGLTIHDAFSELVNQWLFIVPLLLGRQFFKTYDQQLLMFKTLVIAGLIYSVLMLFEIRMSPQLHSWIYGYFPHDFGQQKRSGGFRPVVFMGHGLWVAFFAMTILLSATTLLKNSERIGKLSLRSISYYLFVLLVLCKSMASLIYGIFAVILIKFLSSKNQLRIATVLVIFTLLYPTMSILKIFPHEQLVAFSESIDEDRAQSLMFRFQQESILLDRGAKKFFFGWGGWSRNRVFDEDTGRDISVTDGRWIITVGQWGWFGFIAEFGLLAMTVFRAYEASKLIRNKKELNLLAGHAILVSIIMLDQLPNASLDPWMWLLAGILLGRAEDIISKDKIQSISVSTKK